jgi:lysozyme
MRTTVPDFSSNNRPEPSFLRLRRAGVRVVGLKATEGLTWTDPTFRARRRRAVALGLRPLPYHFARPDLHPQGARDEARHFVSVAGKRAVRRFALALDFEKPNPHLSRASMVAWARAFSQETHRLTGSFPGFYSYTSFVHDLAPSTPIGAFLWLADYGPNDGTRHPVTAPHPWKRIRLHQYTSRGLVDGAHGGIDLSAILY